MILLSDANILIILEDVGAIGKLPLLGDCEVLDVILEECLSANQPKIAEHVQEAGIKIIHTDMSVFTKAASVESTRLSQEDKMILVYAADNDRVVLTGDKPLRQACKKSYLEYHGVIWLMQQFEEKGVVTPEVICDWIKTFKEKRRYLPAQQIDELKEKYGC